MDALSILSYQFFLIALVKALTIEMQHLFTACTELRDCLMSLQRMPSAYLLMFFSSGFSLVQRAALSFATYQILKFSLQQSQTIQHARCLILYCRTR